MTWVSVVVNTYNRATSLAATLESMRWLDHTDVELVVVNGPSTDATEDVIASFRGRIKVARCPTRNLSRSRNIGARLAAGAIIAFIDDDAVADPAWLTGILPLFADPEVGAVGGPVFNHTGTSLQAHYIICDRFGSAELRQDRDPSPLLNVPDGAKFCSTLGTNSLFRRSALVAIGGFDEEYDYFLDETDVCIRMMDAGWTVRYSSAGHVYHRYLPSHIRNESRVVSDYGSVIKNKAYFAMRHGAAVQGQAAVQHAIDEFAQSVHKAMTSGVEAGLLEHRFADHFKDTFDERIRYGIGRAFLPRQSSLDARHSGPELPLQRFPTFAVAVGRRLHMCYVSQDYPPGVVAGIARVTYELATGLAQAGHVVRVLTRGPAHTVDFENGVWVHRLPDLDVAPPDDCADLPLRIWGRAVAVLRELERINNMRPIDLVQAPNWDVEGLAVIRDGRWPLVLGVYTPMTAALRYNPAWQNDAALLRTALHPIIAAERYCYQTATAVLACGPAILEQVHVDYGVGFADRHVGLVPHGQIDAGGAPAPPVDKPVVEVLCVGRLEGRKGSDVLLAAVPELFADLPELRLLMVGDDTQAGADGKTMKQMFLQDPANAACLDRIQFLGQVDDATLDALYRQCDIVAVPSRFESFGLPLIEAMMRGRPIVASDVGGMAEIVETPGEVPGTGYLVPVDDPKALAAALRSLAVSASQRRAMGARGRALFLARYTRDCMVRDAAEFYMRLVESPATEEHHKRPAAS